MWVVMTFQPRQGESRDQTFASSLALPMQSTLLSPQAEIALWSSLAIDLLCDVEIVTFPLLAGGT